MSDPEKVFSEIYTNGLWSPNPWNSGPGSDPDGEGEEYCRIICTALLSMNANRVVDLGCGDGRVLARLAAMLPKIEFIGLDCCPEVIKSCAATWPRLLWEVNDLSNFSNIPRASVYLMKDVLHHWPTARIDQLFHELDTYGLTLIATQDSNQAKDAGNSNDYDDCPLGGYRPLSEKSYPFNAYQPAVLARYLHKSILLIRFE